MIFTPYQLHRISLYDNVQNFYRQKFLLDKHSVAGRYSVMTPANDSQESCERLIDNCENIINDEFVFGKGASGNLTMYFIFI